MRLWCLQEPSCVARDDGSCRVRGGGVGGGGCWSLVAGRSCCLSVGHFPRRVRRTRRHCPICPVDAMLGALGLRRDSTAAQTRPLWYCACTCSCSCSCALHYSITIFHSSSAVWKLSQDTSPPDVGHCARTRCHVHLNWPHGTSFDICSAAGSCAVGVGCGASWATQSASVSSSQASLEHEHLSLSPADSCPVLRGTLEHEYATAVDPIRSHRDSRMCLPAIPTHRADPQTLHPCPQCSPSRSCK